VANPEPAMGWDTTAPALTAEAWARARGERHKLLRLVKALPPLPPLRVLPEQQHIVREIAEKVRLPVVSETRVSEPVLREGTYHYEDGQMYEGRPKTRLDCQPGGEHHHRPCPFVTCPHNTFNAEIEDEDPWDANPDTSCVLDVVDENPQGIDVRDIGEALWLAEDEVNEAMAAAPRLQEVMEAFRDHQPSEEGTTLLGDLCSNFQGGNERGLKDEEDDRSGRVLPDRFYIDDPPAPRPGATRLFERFGYDPVVPEAEYLRAFWKVYERSSRSHTEDIAAAADATWVMFRDLLVEFARVSLFAERPKKFGVRRGG